MDKTRRIHPLILLGLGLNAGANLVDKLLYPLPHPFVLVLVLASLAIMLAGAWQTTKQQKD